MMSLKPKKHRQKHLRGKHKLTGKFPKVLEKTTEGKCEYCNKRVKSLEAHIHDKHKGEKLVE